MELKDVIEKLLLDETAEGGIATIAAIVLMLLAVLGGGMYPVIEALAGKI